MKAEATGYLHPGYAASLAEFGTPRLLPRSEGWILVRKIPGFPFCDGMGCYPLFACRDWEGLHADLAELRNELVSLALVADPFGDYDLAHLRRCFGIVTPFKQHFVVDLSQSLDVLISRHHRRYRRYIKRSLQHVQIERCEEPTRFLDDWSALYATLVERHRLSGIKAFSRAAFAGQLRIPGIVMFRAVYQGTTVGAILWYVQGDVCYGHLEALSPEAYRLAASYALYWSSIAYFSTKVRWIHLGGGAGVKNDGTDGLTLFKQGWATGTRTAYFCGEILDQERYSRILQAKRISATDYFPAYREEEFGQNG